MMSTGQRTDPDGLKVELRLPGWIVAYPDRTAFLGDYFRIGDQPAGTGQ
jgi:hypothetical protein